MPYFKFELCYFWVEKAYFIFELWDAEGAEDADYLFLLTEKINLRPSVCSAPSASLFILNYSTGCRSRRLM